MISDGGANTSIRVLVVDDHEMVGQSIAEVINAAEGMEAVGVAVDTGPAKAAVDQLDPDVVLMDYEMPSGDGITAAGEIKAKHPNVKILILTGHDVDEIVPRAISEGCDGFLHKASSVAETVDAVRLAAAGEAVFSPDDLIRAVRRIRQPSRLVGDLTEREIEVLELMTGGVSTKGMAAQLYISENTVRTHVRHILEKLDAHSKLEAVSIALREGIVAAP